MTETIYEEERNGYTIKIHPDYHYDETPNDWENNIFLVAFHRDFTIDVEGFDEELCRAVANGGKYEDGSKNEEALDVLKQYHVFGLEAYIHGGVSLSLSNEGNYPDRQWDVSQLGLVFVSKKETRFTKKARAYAQQTLKVWNAILSGNVYGFEVEDTTHGTTFNESCWGFVETDYRIEKTSVLEEARSVADYAYKYMLKKHIEERKAQIKHNVPLHNRPAFC